MLGFIYGKSTSTNNIRSFSIFLTDENDESVNKEIKIREGHWGMLQRVMNVN